MNNVDHTDTYTTVGEQSLEVFTKWWVTSKVVLINSGKMLKTSLDAATLQNRQSPCDQQAKTELSIVNAYSHERKIVNETS